jgi:excisionase family DNA binding protein
VARVGHRATTSSAPHVPSSAEGTIADRIAKIDHALRVTELAEILNVSRQFLYELAASGKLPSLRVGGAVRFDPAAVAAWFRQDIRNR